MKSSYFNIYLKKSLRVLQQRPSLAIMLQLIKFYKPWRGTLREGENSLARKIPWLTFSAISFIEKIVRRDMKVFEYGSGGSTLFWAERVNEIVSVEHDKLWYEKMISELPKYSTQALKPALIESAEDSQFLQKDFKNPLHYISSDSNYNGKNFESYVKAIDKFPDEYFDIVVVDGRARPSCIAHAVSKIKKNGYLLVDNSEREYYLSGFDFQRPNWERKDYLGPVPFSTSFSQTSIIQKLK